TLNFTGDTKSDLIRLNTSIPPSAPAGAGNPLGLLGGDFAGFPNGRRLEDDVTDIELRAFACGYGSIVAPIIEGFGFCAGNANRAPNNLLGDGVDHNEKPFLTVFPYGAAAAIAPHVKWQGGVPAETMTRAPAVGMSGAPPTSADGLRRRISEMESRLRDQPEDTGAAVLLADALFRQARGTGDVRATGRAGALLTSVLKNDPEHYEATRMLGA